MARKQLEFPSAESARETATDANSETFSSWLAPVERAILEACEKGKPRVRVWVERDAYGFLAQFLTSLGYTVGQSEVKPRKQGGIERMEIVISWGLNFGGANAPRK